MAQVMYLLTSLAAVVIMLYGLIFLLVKVIVALMKTIRALLTISLSVTEQIIGAD